MDRSVLVTGGTGFLGQAVVRALGRRDWNVLPLPYRDIDLRSTFETDALLRSLPHGAAVVHLAYPGGDGIGDALAHPATIAIDLLQMDLNVIRACAAARVPKLVCIGSVCAYPEHTIPPTDEPQLWNGYPEPVNASYGMVKRAQLTLLQACRQEYGLNGIHLILPNLYGPGDRTNHVIPALIRRMRVAKRDGTPLVVWGDPAVTRSFLYVDDAAAGIVRALERYDSPEPLNLVQHMNAVSMQWLVAALARLLDFRGAITFDDSKPTGHRERLFSGTRMRAALDWQPPTVFVNGLVTTFRWHLEQEQI